MEDETKFNCLSSFNWNYQMSISCLLEDMNPIFNIPNSYFLEDIDPIFKMFTNLSNESAGCFRQVSLPKKPSMFNILRFQEILFENDSGNFLELFGVIWCIQILKWLFLGGMDTFKNPKTMRMMTCRGFPKFKSKSY